MEHGSKSLEPCCSANLAAAAAGAAGQGSRCAAPRSRRKLAAAAAEEAKFSEDTGTESAAATRQLNLTFKMQCTNKEQTKHKEGSKGTPRKCKEGAPNATKPEK